MQRETDAKELSRLVRDVVTGGAPNAAGIFGPFGMDRGVKEELLKQSSIVSSKISNAHLTESDVDQFFGLCQVSVASGVMSDSDIEKLAVILERNK